jgi:hypothetical protein
MKIIYTQKRSSSHIRKRLLLAFECLTLIFVMCFFGMLLARQKLNGLENEYKSIISSGNEQIKDVIELIIPLEESSNE